MKILLALRKGLSFVGLTKEKTIHLAGHHISSAFLRWFLLLSNTALILMEIYIFMLLAPKGIEALLVPIHLLIAFVSVYLIWISLMLNVDHVIELIDILDEVVTKSMSDSSYRE